ncbi:MAG: hypothetical protein J6N54_08950, partial [Bacteroidales bacterium]|nr:hypothetical protein [Bacteroidales bacterium]
MLKRLLVFTVAALFVISCGIAGYDEVKTILSRQVVTFNEPPSRIPAPYSVDAPLMGNGFTGVALAGKPEEQVFYISRNDFWRLKSAHDETYPAVLCHVRLSMPGLVGASYQVDQSLYDATTLARFEKGGKAVSIKTYVAATQDLLVISLSAEGEEPVEGSVVLEPADSEVPFPGIRESGTTADGLRYLTRAFEDSSVEIPAKAAAAMLAKTGADGSFTLRPGKPMTIVCAFSSNFKSDDCLQTV